LFRYVFIKYITYIGPSINNKNLQLSTYYTNVVLMALAGV